MLLQVKNEVDHDVSLSEFVLYTQVIMFFPMRNVSFLRFHNDYVIESDYGILIQLIFDDAKSFYISFYISRKNDFYEFCFSNFRTMDP